MFVCSPHHLVDIAVALRVQRYEGVALRKGEVVQDRVRAYASSPLRPAAAVNTQPCKPDNQMTSC